MCQIFILVFILMFSTSAHAVKLLPAQQKNIERAQYFLNSLKTISSDFVQISPYNKSGTSSITLSYGKLYVSRPGNVRWEYSKPTPIEIIITDGRLIYYDKELDQISYTTLESGLSTFLTDENINLLSGRYALLNYSDDAEGFSFVLEDVIKPESEGEKKQTEQLRLAFTYEPFQIARFQYKDLSGYVTTVEFKQPSFGTPVDKELFVFKNPKYDKNVWDK